MKEIKLTQGKTALVDDQDYDWLTKFKWFAHKSRNTYYAITSIWCSGGKQIFIRMHQLILDRMFGYNDENELISDHEDRNGLNNQRKNLRRVSHNFNIHNSKPYGKSKYKGVYWYKNTKKWQAQTNFHGKRTHLGYFNNEKDAAEAYNKMAKEIYGDNAVLNNI